MRLGILGKPAALAAVVISVCAAPAAHADTYEYVKKHERVDVGNGVELDGWIWRPKGLDDRPVVLSLSVYHGTLDPDGGSDAAGSRPSDPGPTATLAEVVPTRALMKNGYAIAFFSAPGTGGSGGCYDYFGGRTFRAGAALVEYLARQDWSSGRVGMAGHSEDGTIAWGVAALRPKGLELIVPTAGVTDRFGYQGTPNGMLSFHAVPNYAVVAPVHGAPPVKATKVSTLQGGVTPQRVCDDVIATIRSSALDPAADERDAGFWLERRVTDRLRRIKAAVLTVAGLRDNTTNGFAYEAMGWPYLDVPKAFVQGQWAHDGGLPAKVAGRDFVEMRMEWFDHFLLRESEEEPRDVGRALFQTATGGGWSSSTSWPPAEAREEVFPLGAATLSRLPLAADGFTLKTNPSPCDPNGRLWTSAPIEDGARTIAGAPFAYLPSLRSDQEGGAVAVHVFSLPPGFGCNEEGTPLDADLITWGAADLRFHDGRWTARSFEDGNVRIDMESAAATVPEGHRIGVLVSSSDLGYRGATAHLPQLELGAGSHVVLPFVGRGLGGATPSLRYPPRANLPKGGSGPKKKRKGARRRR